ncbi:MAG: hypothetical protein K0Q97_75 [Bacillota bacterium]|jgi:Na+-transporting methylmalonyl-CoA/oxaloacetate decarboxylase gamma subunit|nr:hypothetical protein [Bacillota bacterium]
MYSGIEIGFVEGLVVTFFSMAVVFLALLVISYIIDVMHFFVKKRNN